MTTINFKPHLDLDNIPILKKGQLCTLLDPNRLWRRLAELMEFSEEQISAIELESQRKHKSPCDILITRWSALYGHNCTELFKLLSLMEHEPAMRAIADLVDERYHIWFPKRETKIENVAGAGGGAAQGDDPETIIRGYLKNLRSIRDIDIHALEHATGNWSKDNILGQGGFGIVYYGNWLETKVAVKRIEILKEGEKKNDFLMNNLNELQHLNNCRHDNILPVYGYTIKDRFCYVVCQFMAGGALDERLALKKEGFPALNWSQRWEIAKGAARGIQYLHRFDLKPLIHADIKPGNILIDEYNVAKIGDFGLSREGNENDECQAISRAFGTRPYSAPEFIMQKLFSTKIDVFSFGVVLFEISTGMKSFTKERKPLYLYDFIKSVDDGSESVTIKLIDKSTPCDVSCLRFCRLLLNLGKQCTEANPNDRPEMKNVLQALLEFNTNETPN